jgi:predicted nucleic acid-binding protein
LQLLDTIVLVASLNTQSEHNRKATNYLNLVIEDDSETFVPLTALLELDLVMKGRSYTFNQMKDAFDWLANFVPDHKVLSNTVGSLKIAVGLEENGVSYFDALISALALERDAIVLTPDETISKVAKTKW